MNLNSAIKFLEENINDASKGLPEEIFTFITKITPIVNVDLLIKDEKGRTLLSWRDDNIHGRGWHIPGGIVRFRERLEDRIIKVAQTEIGVNIQFDPTPIAINQIINYRRKIRGHFISLLFKCFLPASFEPENRDVAPETNGFLKWHTECPSNLIEVHNIYRKYI